MDSALVRREIDTLVQIDTNADLHERRVQATAAPLQSGSSG
jgi:hypothetical protein